MIPVELPWSTRIMCMFCPIFTTGMTTVSFSCGATSFRSSLEEIVGGKNVVFTFKDKMA